MTDRMQPALIEIVERVRTTEDMDADAMTGGYVRPQEIRLNGVPLAVPLGAPITVHPIVLNDGGDDLLKVTFTLYARRVVFGAEPIGEGEQA